MMSSTDDSTIQHKPLAGRLFSFYIGFNYENGASVRAWSSCLRDGNFDRTDYSRNIRSQRKSKFVQLLCEPSHQHNMIDSLCTSTTTTFGIVVEVVGLYMTTTTLGIWLVNVSSGLSDRLESIPVGMQHINGRTKQR
ncbi:unnamed protein product [Ectocarpus sp. 12 AP-2014]